MPHPLTCDKCGLSEREIEIGTMTSALGNLIAVCPTCAVIQRNKIKGDADALMIRRQRQRIVNLEAALIRIAGHEKSGELWASYNATDDECAGQDEPDFEATNDDLASHIGEMRLLMEQMAEALKECADDLESEVIARNPTIAGEQEIMKRRRTRDLLPVQSARSALSAYERVRKLYSIETATTEVRTQSEDVST